MTQRWIAVFIAAPLLCALLVASAVAPLPYAVYSPGPTFDILAKDADEAELIQVDGAETYYDDGQIRFTTVQTSARGNRMSLIELLQMWADPDRAVIPYDVAHPKDITEEDEEEQGQVAMATSQDVAKAVALTELGHDLKTSTQVVDVVKDSAAHGVLEAGDVILRADGRRVKSAQDVVDAVTAHEVGDPVGFVVRRGRQRLTVDIAPRDVGGEPKVGISVGEGFEFPFEIKLRVDPLIGGPSAGLMFALGIYDTLTPGSLTGGETIAGTGALNSEGEVGPIGGVEQKIAGAEDAGAKLFFVPADNCPDVAELDPDLRLVKATTMHSARLALEKWADDPDARLPAC